MGTYEEKDKRWQRQFKSLKCNVMALSFKILLSLPPPALRGHWPLRGKTTPCGLGAGQGVGEACRPAAIIKEKNPLLRHCGCGDCCV